MTILSSAAEAAVRVMRGESDLETIRVAIKDWRLARALALSNSASPTARTIAALQAGLPALLDESDLADPAVHAFVRSVIDMNGYDDALSLWLKVAPAGWSAGHVTAIMDAMQRGACFPDIAAALIGPSDDAVNAIMKSVNIETVIRQWGRADPNTPTAWMARVSPNAWRRLHGMLLRDRHLFSSCIPWLPPEAIPSTAHIFIPDALDAFADASPVARARHASLLSRMLQTALPEHLGALTRLALVARRKDVWRRVQDLANESPDMAVTVVVAAPWSDLPDHVRKDMLNAAKRSDICAAIAAARGRSAHAPVTNVSATAFFAALNPVVWDALPPDAQRQWLDALPVDETHLAIRSLGLRTEFLARARLNNDLVIAARRHAPDAAALCTALFPVSLFDVDVITAPLLIAAMPETPPDPGAFFCIAAQQSPPDIIARARAALRTPSDLAVAVTVQRFTSRPHWVYDRCAALHHALRGRTWSDVSSPLAFLGDHARALAAPDLDHLARRMAAPDRRVAMRRALDAIAALPPTVAIPALSALGWRTEHADLQDIAAAFAHALHAHGDHALAVIDALASNALRRALLPLPDDPHAAHAVRVLARDDFDVGRRLARALERRAWNAARSALLHASADHAHAILRSLPDEIRSALLSNAGTYARSLADAARSDALHTAFQRIASVDPLAALALADIAAHLPDVSERGIATLARTPQIARMLLPLLRSDIQDILRSHPVIDAVCADLSETANATNGVHAAITRRTQRRSMSG